MQKTLHYELKKPEITDPLRVTDFNENNDLIDAALAAVNTTLANKAETSALTALQNSLTSTNSNVSALTTALGSGGSNCRIATGSYVGTGTYGSDNPTALTFDFTPLLVMVGSAENAEKAHWPSVFIRGCTGAHGESSAEVPFYVTWTERSVSWYLAKYSSPGLQNNESGRTYYYCVIG